MKGKGRFAVVDVHRGLEFAIAVFVVDHQSVDAAECMSRSAETPPGSHQSELLSFVEELRNTPELPVISSGTTHQQARFSIRRKNTNHPGW